jgi:hypothetical protein
MRRLWALFMGAVGTAALSYILHLPWKLFEAAIFEEIIHEIPAWVGPMSPTFQYAINLSISWVPPIAIAIVCVWLIYQTGFAHGKKVHVPATILPPRDIVAANDTKPSITVVIFV